MFGGLKAYVETCPRKEGPGGGGGEVCSLMRG